MPTLLQINVSANSGSTGRIAEQLGQYVLTQGWQSYIAYGRRCKKSKSEVIRIGTKLDFSFHVLKTRLLDKHGLGSVIATRKFLDQISWIKPDIVHLHNIHGYYINYPILFDYLAKNNIPVVWTMHDNWPISGHCTYFADIDCAKWKTGCNTCPKKHNYPSSVFLDNSSYNYALKKRHFTSLQRMTIISVSKWLCSIIKESFLADYPLRIINNGVDLNVFYPHNNCKELREKYKIINKFILLGVASTWDKRKGLADYIKLSASLSDDYVIVLVGLSKKQKALLPVNIIGIERIEDVHELAQLYSAADIVLNLSSQESFGMTTIEGFACGTPGIVFNCTASPELISPETGFIIEQGDINQLINVIEKIKSIGKKHFTVNCRKRAELYYNLEMQCQNYMQLYGHLIDKIRV